MTAQKDRIEKFAHLFGTVSDEKIAKMAKVPTAAVMAARQARERAAAASALETQPEVPEVAPPSLPEPPAGDLAPELQPEPVQRRPAVIRLRRRVEVGGRTLFASVYENEMVDVVGELVAPLLEGEPDLVEVLAWQE